MGKCRAIDASRAIEKLRELASDPVTGDQSSRITRLLHDYLGEIGDEGYPVKHLPAVMKVLEFLSWKSREMEDYRAHLDRMLRLCSRPPLLERTSASLASTVVMEHYFTLLGYLLTISRSVDEMRRIHEILDCLLIGRSGPRNVAAVKLDARRRAMENSRLPIIVVELLEAALPRVYPRILELAFTLASISHRCCYRMLEAGILNTLLIRMDLPYATQLRCVKPPDVPLGGEEYSWDTMLLTTNLLWSLVGSILSSKKPPECLNSLPAPRRCAMWGLRYSFKRQILRGQYCAANLRIRNDIAALILAGIVALPTWNLISSGIAEDIVNLLDIIECGTAKIWTMDVKFTESDEDFLFKRILLTIVAHLAHVDVYVFVMKKAMIIPIILRIIKYCTNDEKDKGSSTILEYAMYILSLLASRISTEFVKRKGTHILSTMIAEVLNAKFDEHFVMILTRTICSIVLQDDALLLEDFRRHEMIPSLIRLISNIVGSNKFTMRRQRVLTLLLVALEGLVKKHTSVQQMHGEQSVGFVMEIFMKCLYQKNEDAQVDQRLLLATGCYVWECVARCPGNLQLFLKNGGVYAMLDIIEIACYPVRCLYLGALTDMCDCTFCGPCLCTWRGTDKKTGLMSLLAAIWREEEDRVGVKRRADGSIADPELPQMGAKQWTDTYLSKLAVDSSPAIVDMIGSVRAKIFSILQIIERDGERYVMAKKHYKILLHELPTADRITLCCVDEYLRLKLGQMWIEVSKYLEQAGVIPLSLDAQLISHMTQWHRSWGIFIEERQRKLALEAKRAEQILEKDEYARIRDCKLAPALEALDEVERIRRTADRSYMLQRKDRQRRQADEALRFPRDADDERCHRTFSDKANVTVVFGQHQSIDSSYSRRSRCSMELPPVSPTDPLHEETFSSLDGASGGSYGYFAEDADR